MEPHRPQPLSQTSMERTKKERNDVDPYATNFLPSRNSIPIHEPSSRPFSDNWLHQQQQQYAPMPVGYYIPSAMSSAMDSQYPAHSSTYYPTTSNYGSSYRGVGTKRSRSTSNFERSKYTKSNDYHASVDSRTKRVMPRTNCITLCSLTLWVGGDLPEDTTEKDLYEIFSEYGTVSNIVLCVPKHCAFVTMKRRDEARRAIDILRASRRLSERFDALIKLDWAPGRGLKKLPQYRQFWLFEIGVAYVPFSVVQSKADLDAIAEGSYVDRNTIPYYLNGFHAKSPLY